MLKVLTEALTKTPKKLLLPLYLLMFSTVFLVKSYTSNTMSVNQTSIVNKLAKSNLVQYSVQEKKLINTVAERLSQRNYPLYLVNRVYLEKKLIKKWDYYQENKITFLINPVIYQVENGVLYQGINQSTQVTMVWEDTRVVYHEDGSMEFEVGEKTTPADLKLVLYGVNDTYDTINFLPNQLAILEQLNSIFLENENTETQHLTKKGLAELLVNHLVSIEINSENTNQYLVSTVPIDYKMRNGAFFNEIDSSYSLNVNIKNRTVTLLKRLYPSFYPTPAMRPSVNDVPLLTE